MKAITVDHYFKRSPTACQWAGVSVLEDVHGAKLSSAESAQEPGVYRHFVCASKDMQKVKRFESRYQMLIGEEWDAVPVPWPEDSFQISRTSMRIVDQLTGKTIAESSMYLMDGQFEKGECQPGGNQIVSLLMDTFQKE